MMNKRRAEPERPDVFHFAPHHAGETHVNSARWYGQVNHWQKVCREITGHSYASLESASLALFREGKLEELLRRLTGLFSGWIYCEGTLACFSDRLGQGRLFLAKRGNRLYVGEHLGTLAANLPDDPQVSVEEVAKFLATGFYPGPGTSITGVEQLAPSEIRYYSESGKSISKRFWTWSQIEACPFSFQESVDICATTLRGIVADIPPGSDVIVSLSGGVDSRLLLSLSLEAGHKIQTVSYGERPSYELAIAERVAKLAGTTHVSCEINQENWFERRAEAVWATNGMCSAIDLHAPKAISTLIEACPNHLEGYMGGIILGGRVVKRLKALDQRINASLANQLLDQSANNHSDSFYDIKHVDPFYLAHYGRQQVLNGPLQFGSQTARLPFTDMRLVNLIYSFSDEYRINHRLFRAMVAKHFPRLFHDIPISDSKCLFARQRAIDTRLLHALKRRTLIILGGKAEKTLDYEALITKDFDRISTHWRGGQSVIRTHFPDILSKGNLMNPAFVGRLLSLEIFLSRVDFERKCLGNLKSS